MKGGGGGVSACVCPRESDSLYPPSTRLFLVDLQTTSLLFFSNHVFAKAPALRGHPPPTDDAVTAGDPRNNPTKRSQGRGRRRQEFEGLVRCALASDLES